MPHYKITTSRRTHKCRSALVMAPSVEEAVRAFAYPDGLRLRYSEGIWYFWDSPLVIDEFPPARYVEVREELHTNQSEVDCLRARTERRYWLIEELTRAGVLLDRGRQEARQAVQALEDDELHHLSHTARVLYSRVDPSSVRRDLYELIRQEVPE